jgi:small subunit ribosomal protein S27Ae
MADEEKPKENKEEAAKPAPAAPAAAEEEKPKAKDKKAEKKGKRVRTGRKHFKVDTYKFYKIEGGKAILSKEPCPRCGPGTWLAIHKGRKYCGRCSYTIFEKK